MKLYEDKILGKIASDPLFKWVITLHYAMRIESRLYLKTKAIIDSDGKAIALEKKSNGIKTNITAISGFFS